MTEGEPSKGWVETRRERVPIAPEGVKTFGLGVEHVSYTRGEEKKEYWKYVLPDVGQVVGLTPEGQAIVIREQRPGIDESYPHAVGETVEKNEKSIVTAIRGLLEESGYGPEPLLKRPDLIKIILDKEKRKNTPNLAEELKNLLGENAVLLTTALHDTTRSDRRIYHWLIKDCVPIGNGEKEIQPTLMDVKEFRDQLLDYLSSSPETPHAGVNSLVAIDLAQWHLSH